MTDLLHTPLAHMTGLLLLSVLLGGLVGWERERHERPAGLRTHILVCLGATLITLVGNSAPTIGGRIAAQIVSGIGFLGAGTIIREGTGGVVRGLTTAASVWAIAGVGIAIGYGGLYAETATIATLIILFTLTLLNRFEEALNRSRRRQALSLVFATDCDALAALSRLLQMMHDQNIHTRDLRLEKSLDSEVAHLAISLPRSANRDSLDLLLSKDKDVLHHQWDD